MDEPGVLRKTKSCQWSPKNLDGKKVYDRDFLIEVKSSNLCKKRPDFILELDIFRDKPNDSLPRGPRGLHGSSSMGGRGDSMGQNHFIRSSSSSNQRSSSSMMKMGRDRGAPVRNMGGLSSSQSGMRSMGNKSNSYSNMNSYTSRDDANLHKDPNSWKPMRFQNNQHDLSEEQKQIEKLKKKVRGILNKLTPQKFDVLVAQILELHTDTELHMKEMVNLVFEKAVDEPSFSKAYADLCKHLENRKIGPKQSTQSDGEAGRTVSSVTFRKLLLTKCQEEFEKNKQEELGIVQKNKEIDAATDLEKKKELKLLLDEEERKMRRKSVGLVRFIGELYKLQMLTPKIMHGCISTLLSKVAEEPLECLCKLLSTIGKELEKHGKKEFDDYFATMHKLAQKTPDSKVSSRIRFMLQDVIELRQKNWKPRRVENAPKTIEEIHKDAERDAAIDSAAIFSTPISQVSRGKHSGEDRRRNAKPDNDGWQTSGKFRNTSSYATTVEPSKLQHFMQAHTDAGDPDISLGGAWSSSSKWTGGALGASSGSMKRPGMDSGRNSGANNLSYSSNNKFAALGQADERIKPYSSFGSKGKVSGSMSLENDGRGGMLRDRGREHDGRKMGSGPPSRENSRSRYAQSGHSPAGSLNSRMERDFKSEHLNSRGNYPLDNREAVESRVPVAEPADLDDEEGQRKADTIFNEWCANNNVKETLSTVNEMFVGQRNVCLLVRLILNKVIEGKLPARLKFAELLVALLKENRSIASKDVITEFKALVEYGDEMVVDIPFFWTHLGEIFAPLLAEGVMVFDDLKAALDGRPLKDKAKVLAEVFKNLLRCQKTNLWKYSNAQLVDFVPEEEVENFIKNNNFWFLSSSSSAEVDVVKCRESLVEILQKIDHDNTFDEACAFLSKIENSVSKKAFIEIVTMAVILASLKDGKLNMRQLRKHIKLIQKFVDNKEERELICLYAIKNLVINELTLELSVLVESFRFLYDESIISIEAFKNWKTDCSVEPLESEGRLLANKTLGSFYVFLAEPDDDEEES